MKVPDNQLEDTIGGLINQAKDGSIHFKELAKELVALGSVYSQFGVTGREGAIQIVKSSYEPKGLTPEQVKADEEAEEKAAAEAKKGARDAD